MEKNRNFTIKSINIKYNNVENNLKNEKKNHKIIISNDNKYKTSNKYVALKNKMNTPKVKRNKASNNNAKNKIELNLTSYEHKKNLIEFDKILESVDSIARRITLGKKKTPISLSPSIFKSFHYKFKPSFYSSKNEFNNNDFIKAYAYNSSEGNIRDYNEDTITATKIVLNAKEKKYFHFFAIYDGHGGNGCSYFLKKYLHKYIKEFSITGIKNAINEAEKTFLEKYALINGKLVDKSGSCGFMVLFQNKKCIIANIGDSRCLLFKNNRLSFSTKDHKPEEASENKRIKLAGGSVYKIRGTKKIYQNGKRMKYPYRVLPGKLSVSRAFGDIEMKDSKYGGKKGVVIAEPDIREFELNENYNFMVIGCDGIFDVLSNYEILECIRIVLMIDKDEAKNINELCKDFADMIIKSALEKESFDNVSCIVIAFNINGLR